MLRERRIAAGYTVKQLAALTGIPYRTIENWEKYGVERGTFGSVVKLADFLELWAEQLITDEYDEMLESCNGESTEP